MFKVRDLNPTCMYSLLLAIAIQSVTPDSNDLASFKLFSMLLPTLTQSTAIGGPVCLRLDHQARHGTRDRDEISSPYSRDDPDEGSDEVCLDPATAYQRTAPLRRVAKALEDGRFFSIATIARRVDRLWFDPPMNPRVCNDGVDLIRLHCRITC